MYNHNSIGNRFDLRNSLDKFQLLLDNRKDLQPLDTLQVDNFVGSLDLVGIGCLVELK